MQNEMVYNFLAGLDLKFYQIRVQNLGQEPPPNLHGAYAYIWRAELHQATMLAGVSQECSTLNTLKIQVHQLSLTLGKLETKSCCFVHIFKTRIAQETCFKLKRYPKWFHKKGCNSNSNTYHASSDTQSHPMAQPQYSQA